MHFFPSYLYTLEIYHCMMDITTKEAFIAYKAAGKYIVKLKVPVGSRTNINRRGIVNRNRAKFRCDKARVLEIRHKHTDRRVHSVRSNYDPTLRYIVGKDVEPRNEYNNNPDKVCASGIHVFLTKEAAYDYNHTIKDGLFQEWHDNGCLATIGMIENNQINGELRSYHENERLSILENLVDGKMSGPCKKWTKDGFLRRIIIYEEDRIKSRITYCEDKQTMFFRSYDNNRVCTEVKAFLSATIGIYCLAFFLILISL